MTAKTLRVKIISSYKEESFEKEINKFLEIHFIESIHYQIYREDNINIYHSALITYHIPYKPQESHE